MRKEIRIGIRGPTYSVRPRGGTGVFHTLENVAAVTDVTGMSVLGRGVPRSSRS
jgi:hypothetical protein